MPDSGDLRRALGPTQVVAAGVSCIVGAGIYLSLGELVAPLGPFVIWAFLLAGLACGLTALGYARFAARFPESGSAFSYVLQGYGRQAGWMTGWTLALEYTVGAGAVVGLWSYLIEKEFGWPQPIVIVVSMTVVTGLVLAGIELWSWVTLALVALKVGTLLLFCTLAAGGTAVPNTMVFDSAVFFRVAGMAVFSFLGFESVSTLAQETRNPKRDMPIGILGSLGVATLLYVVVSGLYARVTPQTEWGAANPLAGALARLGYAELRPLVTASVVIGLSTVAMAMVVGQTRILFAMARAGLGPAAFGEVHPRFGTPWKATLVVGAVVAGLALSAPGGLLYNVAILGTLSVFTAVALAGPNKALGWTTAAVNIVLMAGLGTEAWASTIAWIGTGWVAGRWLIRR
jgi:basic amino acid/polyamine antiporter, APA family